MTSSYLHKTVDIPSQPPLHKTVDVPSHPRLHKTVNVKEWSIEDGWMRRGSMWEDYRGIVEGKTKMNPDPGMTA